jgi:hypothetical protein
LYVVHNLQLINCKTNIYIARDEMAKKSILAMNVKKIVPWGNGLAIYLTKEAKLLKWNRNTRVIVTVIEDHEGTGIEIRKAPITESSF